MKTRILLYVMFFSVAAACGSKNGDKTAGLPNLQIDQIDTNSTRLSVDDFVYRSPDLEVLRRDRTTADLYSLQIHIDDNQSFSLKMRSRYSVVEAYRGRIVPNSTRTILVLQAGPRAVAQVVPFADAQGILCANVSLYPSNVAANLTRPAMKGTVCEDSDSNDGYGHGHNHDHDHDHHHRW